MHYDLLIFDLDGTLVDSAPDLRHAVNQMLAEQGAEPLPLQDIRKMIGDGAAQLVARAYAARSLELRDPKAALQRFFHFYEADPTANTILYDGVRDTLSAAARSGFGMAVSTNKPEGPARVILERLGVAGHFSAVVGGDTHAFRKPDPRMLTLLMEKYGVAAARTLMIGDSEVDAATAHAAQVPFALMTYGYRRGAVSDINCLAALEEFSQLRPLIGTR